jgi:hypothetical protein
MSRHTTLPSPWSDLAEKCGGVEALAEQLGVCRNTIGYWGRGRIPRRHTREYVEAFATKHEVVIVWGKAKRRKT